MQTFFPPQKSELQEQKIYCYANQFDRVVIAKVSGLENRQCERVVFPTEKFLFAADDSCELEIHRRTDVGITQDIILCSDLEVIKD